MSVRVPTSQSLYEQMIAELEGELGQTVPILKKAFLRVLAVALSGLLALLYRYAGSIALDAFPRTANATEQIINGRRINKLRELGRRVGCPDMYPAVPAEIRVSAVTKPGTTFPQPALAAGTQFKHASGVVYSLKTATPVAASPVLMDLVAIADGNGGDGSGIQGNRSAGETVDFVSPPAVYEKATTVSALLVTGEDAESIDEYRDRVVMFTGARKRGGAPSDWVEWGSTVPNVRRVYPYAGAVAGTTDIWFSVDDQPNYIPTAAQVEAVEVALRFTEESGEFTANRSGINELPNVRPVQSLPFNVTVYAVAGVSDLTATRAKIVDALTDYFEGREPFCEGVMFPPRKDFITGTAIASVVGEVVLNDGGTNGTVSTTQGGSPVVALTLGQGQLARLGTVTWA